MIIKIRTHITADLQCLKSYPPYLKMSHLLNVNSCKVIPLLLKYAICIVDVLSVLVRRMAKWCEKPVHGVLLDITGVLYDSGPDGGTPIPGSIDAVKR